MRLCRFAVVLLSLSLHAAIARADVDLRGPLYNPIEYAKVERYIGGFLLFDRSLSLREAGFLEGGVSFQTRPRGILILGADLFLQLGIDNFQFTVATQRADSSRVDTQRWEQRQGGYQQVIDTGPVMTTERAMSEAQSARGLSAAAGGRVHIGAALWRFDITAFLGATVAGGVMSVPGVGVSGIADFKLETGLQLMLNAGSFRIGIRAGVGVFESHLTDVYLSRSMRSGGPTGSLPPSLDYNPDGGPLDVKQVTTGTMQWWSESSGVRREDRIDVSVCLVLSIPWSDTRAEPYPHHAESYEEESSRPVARTPLAVAPTTTPSAQTAPTSAARDQTPAPTGDGGPLAPSTGDAAPDEPEPSPPSVAAPAASVAQPAAPVPPPKRHPKPHRTPRIARIAVAKSTPRAVEGAPITATTPAVPPPAAEPPSRAISALATQVERALAAADSALDQIEQEEPSRLVRAADVWRGKLVYVEDVFNQFRRSNLRLLGMYRDHLARARELAAKADATTDEAERKRLLHRATVLLLATLGDAQLTLFLINGALIVAHGHQVGSPGGMLFEFSKQVVGDYLTLFQELVKATDDAKLMRALARIDENRATYVSRFNDVLAEIKKGVEPVRRAMKLLEIASLALSLYQVARMPVSASGGTPPAMLAPAGISGGAAVAARGSAALAETAQAIKKLVALGALDPAVVTIGAGPALPASQPQLPKLEPLRQDAASTSGSPLQPAQASELRLRPGNVEKVIAAVKKRYGLSAEEARLIREAAKTDNEKWNLPDALRGKVSHVLAGENLPPSTKTIDHVGAIRQGAATEVTSFKSHNLYAESMSKPGGTFATLKEDIDALSNFKPQPVRRAGYGRFKVTADTRRILQVEVPPRALRHMPGEADAAGRLREQFIKECEQARAYANAKGIELKFVEAIQ